MAYFNPLYSQENKLHRFILMALQIQQQMLFHQLNYGSLDSWIPKLEDIFCPQCGSHDWDIINTKVRTNTNELMDYSVYKCKKEYCQFAYPPDYIKNEEVDRPPDTASNNDLQ